MARSNPSNFWHPRYWPNWLGLGLLRLVRLLPFQWQLKLGKVIGYLAYYLAKSRRHIAETNVRLCFPEKSASEQQALVKDIFLNSGMGIIETGYAWSASIAPIASRFQFVGLDNLKQAQEQNRGVMLLGMHFSTLDLCGAALAREVPFHVMYRKNKNPLLEQVMSDGRRRHYPAAIERANIRAVIRALKDKQVVWYGPDQDYGRKQSVFAPFFGLQAASITATARIAKLTGAVVVPFFHYRTDTDQYVIHLGEPLQAFPSGDDVADATRVNQIVEQAILKAPGQYWWVHRRFKTRPEGESRPY
ncbi:MAG: LpxL/LpxP family Kdo(2)-lipid IV(A) lauroyl/palmitoleoyl acyltransferase [Pseudomonadales bacterium]